MSTLIGVIDKNFSFFYVQILIHQISTFRSEINTYHIKQYVTTCFQIQIIYDGFCLYFASSSI